MTQEQKIETTVNTVEEKAVEEKSKKAPSPANVPEVQEVDGYVTTDYAAKLLAKALEEEVKTSRINYLAYSNQVEAIRIGSTMLINRKSLEGLFTSLKTSKEEASKKAQIKKALSDLKQQKKASVKELEAEIEKLTKQLNK